MLAADRDRDHVADHAGALGDRARDPRQLAGAMRDLDAVGAVEHYGTPLSSGLAVRPHSIPWAGGAQTASRPAARDSERAYAALLGGRCAGSFRSAGLTAALSARETSSRPVSGGSSWRWAQSTRIPGRSANGGVPRRHSN